MSVLSPTSHPSAALLAAYAAGWIARPADICVRVHIETCAACQSRVVEFEAAEAAFVDAQPDADVSSDEMLKLIATLKASSVEVASPRVRSTVWDIPLPRALDAVAIARRRWVSPGFWVAPILDGRSEGWRSYLLRVPGGLHVPSHRHSGQELICVLSGAFVEGGSRYAAGDFVQSEGDSEHSLSVATDGPCVCFIAHKGRLKWRGVAKLLGPLLQV